MEIKYSGYRIAPAFGLLDDELQSSLLNFFPTESYFPIIWALFEYYGFSSGELINTSKPIID